MVSILFAFAAAFSNSVNVVTQHVASTAAPASTKGWRLALYLVRNPLWLFGVIAMVGSFVLQAVGPLLRAPFGRAIHPRHRAGVLFGARAPLAAPDGGPCRLGVGVGYLGGTGDLLDHVGTQGRPRPGNAAGLAPGAAHVRRSDRGAGDPRRFEGRPSERAALYATGSGIVWAILATFMKSATEVLGTHGVVATLEQGAIYGLIVAGIVGTVLTQAALHYGPLSISQPLMVIVDPVVSVILSVWIFGEHFEGGIPEIALGTLGFAAMVVGVVFLARTAPSFEATPTTTQP